VGCRVEADVASYSAEADLIMLPAPNAGCVQPTSFEHSHRLITDARGRPDGAPAINPPRTPPAAEVSAIRARALPTTQANIPCRRAG